MCLKRNNLNKRPSPKPQYLAAMPDIQTNKSTTDFIIRTKQTATETINAIARGRSEMPVIQR